MDRRYKLRKVLVPKFPGRASMTVARFVPWGIQPEPGVKVKSLGRYLGIRRDHMAELVRRLGIVPFYEPGGFVNRHRVEHGRCKLITEEEAAKVIVHVRVREGSKLLKVSVASPAPAPLAPAQEVPRAESTGK